MNKRKSAPGPLAPVQLAYAQAEAFRRHTEETQFTPKLTELEAAADPNHDWTEDRWIAHYEKIEDLRDGSGLSDAEQWVREAEQALIAWGREIALGATSPYSPEVKETVADLFEKLPRHPLIKQKVIALCLRIDARTIPAA